MRKEGSGRERLHRLDMYMQKNDGGGILMEG